MVGGRVRGVGRSPFTGSSHLQGCMGILPVPPKCNLQKVGLGSFPYPLCNLLRRRRLMIRASAMPQVEV